MNLKITCPDDFPLHGLDRDMFGTKLRDALRVCFYGNTVRQLAGRVDARRARVVPDALPLRQIADEPVNHAAGHAMKTHATNRQPDDTPPIYARQPAHTSRIWLAAGRCAAAAIGGAAWKLTWPAVPLNATVISTSPAQILRELAGSVPDGRRPYRVSVQVEPQDTGTTPR
ncbi:hypothetical protein SAMN02787142_7959 [Burkholderia sp. WP9]|uniref:hypothetical protein n=1 Tax=Burkholderia sp. WP9 TaxID=1500263 RepID=UPI00089AD4BE|nr:hypothetical protein [Burkholderia sp. WP9]SEF12991.1 hypothetical protein SAMN02787142_7959 [Burkholderia sp. WP9]